MLTKAFKILLVAQTIEAEYQAAIADGKLTQEEILDLILGGLVEIAVLIIPALPQDRLEEWVKRAAGVEDKVVAGRAIAAETLDKVGGAYNDAIARI